MVFEDHIGYSKLLDDAIRSVILKVVDKVSKEGFKGDHHFLISFFTRHKGVVLSKKLLEIYPETMTIILQYQFEDLGVDENNNVTVTLSFNGIKERIIIPIDAIISFADPSVRFGLRFNYEEEDLMSFDEDELIDENIIEDIENLKEEFLEAIERNKKNKNTKEKGNAASKDSGDKGKSDKKGPNVVSLDTFRKKKD